MGAQGWFLLLEQQFSSPQDYDYVFFCQLSFIYWIIGDSIIKKFMAPPFCTKTFELSVSIHKPLF